MDLVLQLKVSGMNVELFDIIAFIKICINNKYLQKRVQNPLNMKMNRSGKLVN